MISGTIYNAGKMLELTQKWEQKKNSGNIVKRQEKELTPEERQLQNYQEDLERMREGNEYSAIYAKIQSGQDLSPAEEEKLRARDPKLYMEYKADKMEQEAYEKRLKNCRTKEEAQKLHVNRMNGKLSELKSIVNNPNIPKSEKIKEAQCILGDTNKTVQVFQEFAKSAEFKDLPTEEEIMKAKQAEAEYNKEKVSVDSDAEGEMKEQTEVITDISASDKKILEEMYELEEKHFGEEKKTVKIDVVL